MTQKRQKSSKTKTSKIGAMTKRQDGQDKWTLNHKAQTKGMGHPITCPHTKGLETPTQSDHKGWNHLIVRVTLYYKRHGAPYNMPPHKRIGVSHTIQPQKDGTILPCTNGREPKRTLPSANPDDPIRISQGIPFQNALKQSTQKWLEHKAVPKQSQSKDLRRTPLDCPIKADNKRKGVRRSTS